MIHLGQNSGIFRQDLTQKVYVQLPHGLLVRKARTCPTQTGCGNPDFRADIRLTEVRFDIRTLNPFLQRGIKLVLATLASVNGQQGLARADGCPRALRASLK